VSQFVRRLKLTGGLTPRLIGATAAVGGLSVILSLLGAGI
jgi:hypothetical protein